MRSKSEMREIIMLQETLVKGMGSTTGRFVFRNRSLRAFNNACAKKEGQ